MDSSCNSSLAGQRLFPDQNKTINITTGTPTPTAAKTAYLFTQGQGVLQSLRISDSKGNNFQMQRDLSKAWVITVPASGAADQGLAGAAETQVGALSIVTTLGTPPDLQALGLLAPAYSIEVGFVSGASHKLEVGIMTPTSSGYYIRLDNGKIYVIANSGIDALLNLLTAPPFPATATPVPASESAATPTP
jgi:hypothetical protein